ncbi:hypothetical protein V2J09_000361 [Rumex salicifolius]
MGGCAGSKLREHGEEEVVLGICKERKRLIKLVVERRYALADSHCRYFHSLHSVSAAIKLFVARHSTPSSPFLITLPPPNSSPENVITNPIFIHQKPSEPKEEAIPPCASSHSSSFSESDSSEDDDESETLNHHHQQQVGSGYGFYMAAPPPMPSPQGGFEWDFFNPFFGVNSEINPDEVLRTVKEEEGVPDLEDEEEVGREKKKKMVDDVKEKENLGCEEVAKTVDSNNGDMGQAEMVLTANKRPVEGRELLDALKDIEDRFIMAYESGKNVSRLLEANKIQLTSGLEEIKENSTKLVKAITWHGSNMARSSSCKSLAASVSKNSSSWIEYKNELFNGYGGTSGSHSLTLGRLNAWEKKLYEEVKAGDTLRKLYEKKCSELRRKDVRGVGTRSLDKCRGAVKESYSQILVTMRRVESISEKIQKLITEEMQPQIIELLQGLAESWKIMLDCHETQKMIISEVKTYECPTFGKFCANSHRLATLQLEAEIQNWQESFHEYIAAQRSYIEALHGWLAKFMVQEVEFYSPFRVNGPPLYTLCHGWLSAMESLPEKAVSVAMRSLLKNIRALWVQQGEEQEQMRRVEKMIKELDQKIAAYKKAESRFDEPKLIEYKADSDAKKGDDVQPQAEQLMKQDLVESIRKRVEMEKERHHTCKQETQRTTLNGFSTGFGFIFESLVHFTKASTNMYNELVTSSQNLGVDGNPS